MIRMGKNSKSEENEETDVSNQTSESGARYPYLSDNVPSATRAISESESMARDIKEGRLSGYVGNGTVLTGETNFQAMLRVDGHLTGRVTSEQGTLIVGSTGKVDANVSVAEAVVNGSVNGDIEASEKLELGRTAKVVGNITAPRLILSDGAILEGGCTMLKAKENFEKRNSNVNAQFTTNELPPSSINNEEISEESVNLLETDEGLAESVSN